MLNLKLGTWLLEKDIRSMNNNCEAMCDEVVQAFLEILNLKEKELAGHNQRVASLAVKLGKKIGLSEQELTDLRRGALLHDIGKICISDEILNKADKLTEKEYAAIKEHAAMGASILRHIRCMERALVVAESHHEHWDGSGYPYGLRGESIPLLARISCVAGAYDALTSQRIYRPAYPKNVALQFIKERSGTYYDPQVVEIFLSMMGDVSNLVSTKSRA